MQRHASPPPIPLSPSDRRKGEYARSPEGTAAMCLKGSVPGDDRWIQIQKSTFTNWVNEQLRPVGLSIDDLQYDFCDGVKLIALIDVLQQPNSKVRGRPILKPINQHQQLENVTIAIRAMTDDDIKMVNIGNEDVVNGNLKLILGLIWHLILRYQIGKTGLPPKKLMLSWLNSWIPEVGIRNFTSHWNDGLALSALVDHCKPGLLPHWRKLNKDDKVNNNRRAMNLAQDHFGIPLIVSPEDLSSADLDELSGMTYMSYYMKDDSPGYHATLRWVNSVLARVGVSVSNFTTDWNDGFALLSLLEALGHHQEGYPNIPRTPDKWKQNCQAGIEAGKKLGVEQIISSKEMSDPEVEPLAVMAYVSNYQFVKPHKNAEDQVAISMSGQSVVTVGQPSRFLVSFLDQDVDKKDIKAEVQGPRHKCPVQFSWSPGGGGGEGFFTTSESGEHQLTVLHNGAHVAGSPLVVFAKPDLSKVTVSGLDRCPVGVPKEVMLHPNGAGSSDLQVELVSPNGARHTVPLSERGAAFITSITATEYGDWKLNVSCDGVPIKGSPFPIEVFDPRYVIISGPERGITGNPVELQVDLSRSGKGEITCETLHSGRPVKARVQDDPSSSSSKIKFTPDGPGSFAVHVYLNGIEVRGSPHSLKVVDTSSVCVSSDHIKCVPVGKLTSFSIDTTDAGRGDIKCIITSPTRNSLDVSLLSKGHEVYDAQFIPKEVGDHQVEVLYEDQLVAGTPFLCHAFDARKVVVGDIPAKGMVGKPVKFEIDCLQAGSGNLELSVNDGAVPCSAQNIGSYRFLGSFTPKDPGNHEIEIAFNEEAIPGSPFLCNIIDPSRVIVSGSGLHLVPVGQLATIKVDTNDAGYAPIKATITSPQKTLLPFQIKETAAGEYSIEYTPEIVGNHTIVLSFDDIPVAASPFTVKAYSANSIQVENFAGVYLINKPISFWLDVGKAGEGNLEIAVNDGAIPNQVTPQGGGRFLVSFTPIEATEHYVDILFNADPVGGSPFLCHVVDPFKVEASGPGLSHALVNKRTHFDIDASKSGALADIDIHISSPSGQAIPFKQTGDPMKGEARVEYKISQIGTHIVEILYAGTPIPGSPFYVKSSDAGHVIVDEVPHGILGKPLEMFIDASVAGEGKLEIAVNDGMVPNRVEPLPQGGKGRFLLTFIPQNLDPHQVDITFNDDAIKGSPFFIPIIDPSQVSFSGDFLQSAPVNELASFNVEAKRAGEAELEATIFSPSNSKVPTDVLGTVNTGFQVEFTPKEVGDHSVAVEYGGAPVPGSPFIVNVYDVASIHVSEIPKGYVGKPVSFVVDASNAGDGNLEISVLTQEGGIRVPNQARPLGEGQFEVTFVPTVAQVHQVFLKFHGKSVPGSPVLTKIIDSGKVTVSGPGLGVVPVDKKTNFFIHCKDAGDADVDVKISGPKGESIPSKHFQQKNGDYKVEFTPNVAGNYIVQVFFEGKPIGGSPFSCKAFDPNRVKVELPNEDITVGQESTAKISTHEAGEADLDVKINAPSGRKVNFSLKEETTTATKRVTFTPFEVGRHKMAVNYGGEALAKSPYNFEVLEAGMATAHGDGLYHGIEDESATFIVNAQGLKGELFVQVDGPNSIAKCNIEPEGNGMYLVTYVPVEVGNYDVIVKWNGKEVPGSPFHPKITDPRKIRIAGGWSSHLTQEGYMALTVGQEKQMAFEAGEAGPGKMTAQILGPGGVVPHDIDVGPGGKQILRFTAREAGEHRINTFWNESLLPHFPMMAKATAAKKSVDASKVLIKGRGASEARVAEDAEFIIDGTEAGPGKPSVRLSGVKQDVDVRVIQTSTDTYKCSYTAQTPGAYLLNILWNDRQIKGSPFKVNIGPNSDPSKVVCSGEGLRVGILGKEIKSFIDTRRAGPGELTATCSGPHMVAFCELFDHRDGTFTLNIRPQEAGRHILQIKYNGENVPGSPYVLRISSAPDASKVRVTGPGVEHGILATYQSRFICETKGAGAGQLTVRVRGPKGAFRVEMQRESQKDRTILCRYDPTEVGDYIVQVKWSGDHVPGSPFHVRIVDSHEELMRLTSDQHPHSPSMNHATLPRNQNVRTREGMLRMDAG